MCHTAVQRLKSVGYEELVAKKITVEERTAVGTVVDAVPAAAVSGSAGDLVALLKTITGKQGAELHAHAVSFYLGHRVPYLTHFFADPDYDSPMPSSTPSTVILVRER